MNRSEISILSLRKVGFVHSSFCNSFEKWKSPFCFVRSHCLSEFARKFFFDPNSLNQRSSKCAFYD